LLVERVVQLAIVAMFLALWEIWLSDIWASFLASKGVMYGVGPAMLGYFIVLCFAFVLYRLTVWSIRRGDLKQ